MSEQAPKQAPPSAPPPTLPPPPTPPKPVQRPALHDGWYMVPLKGMNLKALYDARSLPFGLPLTDPSAARSGLRIVVVAEGRAAVLVPNGAPRFVGIHPDTMIDLRTPDQRVPTLDPLTWAATTLALVSLPPAMRKLGVATTWSVHSWYAANGTASALIRAGSGTLRSRSFLVTDGPVREVPRGMEILSVPTLPECSPEDRLRILIASGLRVAMRVPVPG